MAALVVVSVIEALEGRDSLGLSWESRLEAFRGGITESCALPTLVMFLNLAALVLLVTFLFSPQEFFYFSPLLILISLFNSESKTCSI